MARRRAKNLDASDIEEIVGMLDGWSGKLTWTLLIDVIERRKFLRYTRQALHNHERIRNAFSLRKKTLLVEPTSESAKSAHPEMRIAMEKISRLEQENIRLSSENDRLLEQFVVWAYNAHVHNITEDVLNRPLPHVNREQTKRK